MDVALFYLHWLAVTVYGGSLFAFAVLLAARRRLAPLSSEAVVRAWRAWGAGLGLSMGTLIFTGLALRWRAYGGFVWPVATAADQMKLAASLVFLLLWFSSFHLEIWTLDPCRKLDQNGEIADRAAYEAAADRVTRQAWLNVALFCAVGLLASAASLP